jgi:hypothetical protein
LRWDQTVDLDVKTGGFVFIRHSGLTDGTGTWGNSIDLIPAKAGSATEAIVPLVEGEILVKFEDDGGRLSTNEASVIVTIPTTLTNLPVLAQREDQDTPPFQGTKTNVFYSAELNGLTSTGLGTLDEIANVDLISSFDDLGGVWPEGTYYFKNALDLGSVFSIDLRRYFVTSGYYPNDKIDSRTRQLDYWSDWDNVVTDSVNAVLYVRRTNDDPTGTPTWSDYQPCVNGTFLGRGFEFKVILQSADDSQNILVTELGYESLFQQRTEQSSAAVSSGAGTATVTFDKAFFVGTATLGGLNAYLPSVGITAQNMATGDYFTLGTVTGTNFQVTFRNAAGTAISRNFTWSAVGYGKSV